MLATPEIIQAAAQSGRLAEALPRYRRLVPLYSDSMEWPAEPVTPGQEHWGRLPLIRKADIRRGFPQNFLGQETNLEDLVERQVIELEHTSGTSEDRTPLLLPSGWWAEQELRALRLNAVATSVFDAEESPRRVTISSPVCSSDICYTGVPTHNERIVGSALHLSLSRFPFLWSESELDRMIAEAAAWKPQFLDVDPVYGVVFALHCERRKVQLPSLRFILCSYEFLSRVHRRILERAFGVPVFNLYGSTETGHLLMQDERGQMRPSLETAFLEVIEPDEAGVGHLVVTTLTNHFMPLVRYQIGDLAAIDGRTYGTRHKLHGRAADAFVTYEGRRATTLQIDEFFAGTEGIAHYQILQRADGPWTLRFVPEKGGPAGSELKSLKDVLGEFLCGQPLEIRAMGALMPESSGKFRLGYPLSH